MVTFETSLTVGAADEPIHGVFIRAPRFRELGPAVEILAEFEAEPVLVRAGRVLAGTLHPELTGSGELHRFFVGMASEPRQVAAVR